VVSGSPIGWQPRLRQQTPSPDKNARRDAVPSNGHRLHADGNGGAAAHKADHLLEPIQSSAEGAEQHAGALGRLVSGRQAVQPTADEPLSDIEAEQIAGRFGRFNGA
jgi:hypothetical protein